MNYLTSLSPITLKTNNIDVAALNSHCIINVCLNVSVQPGKALPPKVTGTTPMTTTVAPNNGPFNCQFSTGFCGWTQSTTDDFNWSRKQGSTQTAGTGPPSDHTGGQYQA